MFSWWNDQVIIVIYWLWYWSKRQKSHWGQKRKRRKREGEGGRGSRGRRRKEWRNQRNEKGMKKGKKKVSRKGLLSPCILRASQFWPNHSPREQDTISLIPTASQKHHFLWCSIYLLDQSPRVLSPENHKVIGTVSAPNSQSFSNSGLLTFWTQIWLNMKEFC